MIFIFNSSHAREALSKQVGPGYYVRSKLHRYVHEDRILLAPGTGDIERRAYLEIFELNTRRVLTVVELLTPTNLTAGTHRDDYLSHREFHLARYVQFVEIDLRRGGIRPQPPILRACDYYALVSRKEHRPQIEMWPVSLRERLPVIPIPLNKRDADVALDLQALLLRAYDAADYGKYIYSEQPDPPLSSGDAAWAAQILASSTNSDSPS